MIGDIGAYLASRGVGIIGTDIFLGTMPDMPDRCLALYALEGERPEFNWDAERPALLIRVRGADQAEADELIASVWRELWNLTGIEVNGTAYHRIEARGSVAPAGRDARGRVYYLANFAVIKEVK